ncbi:MAG: chromate resistance protein ChrB [Nocardiopsaceae bacterium]|nr:chromate resistance protein ChrB [Nocardiopsaceae bacterium]
MSWRLITYRLPAEPSRHRVAVWRELRRLGAVPLQQGTWVLPEGEVFDAGLTQVIATISDAGGQPVVLKVANDDIGTVSLEDLFTAQREAEWGEFLRECAKYEAELDDEVAKGKLTLAELDEEEESLERLRRWYRTIRGRDAYGAPSASEAERRLQECADALEHFAELVYQAKERP